MKSPVTKKRQINKKGVVIILVLALFGVLYRFIDYPPNFTPVAAIALFAGYYFRTFWIAALPVLILFFSDIFLGGYQWQVMASVYASFAAIVLIGRGITRKHYAAKMVLGSLAGSVLFFLVTNLAVWYFGGLYEHTTAGLGKCFYMAVPFFRNTLMGDLFFTGLVFSAYELYEVYTNKYALKAHKYVKSN